MEKKDSEVWTDSLWIIPERDKSGKHDGFYHGNFVPQIPHQLILKYTKAGDYVLDPFLGSGTTAFEAETLKRKFIGIEIQEKLVDGVRSKIDSDSKDINLISGDSTSLSTFKKVNNILGHNKIKLAILHPPYFDILKFSEYKRDISNASDLRTFLSELSKVIRNSIGSLDQKGYLAIVMGDKYTKGEWIPLGFYAMFVAQKLGLKLKSIIVKNMEGNRAKQGQQALWRYRALNSDYYIFKHEYIFILKKEDARIKK